MADSTWKTYKTAVESFQSFRKLYNLQDTWPAPLYDLLFYIAYMSHTGLSASTITAYISGIRTMHKLNGQTDNMKSFLVTNHIEGWAKYLLNYSICEMIEKIRLPFCMFST
jgi:site-specific recombinase XerD